MSLKHYIQISRPANIITAIADVLAGIAITNCLISFPTTVFPNVIALCIATIGLYGGGIVFNDIFDLELDKIERPERVIPSGKISKQNAILFGSLLFFVAIMAAFYSSITSGFIAILIAILALFYDKYGKHYSIFGPINMGLCRGANLLLGISILPSFLESTWWYSIVPIVYIAAITMISRGEVHGGKKNILYLAGAFYIIIGLFQLSIAYTYDSFYFAIGFVLLHQILIFKPLLKAIENPVGANIGKAVKAGVLSIIVLDAAWASTSQNILFALFILLLLPLSIKLAKAFAVT